jgi:hypothetical protein
MVTLLVPLAPACTIVTLVGEAASEKFGAAPTVKLTDVVCVKLPDTPVIVTVAAPVAAVAPAVKVKVVEVVEGFGLNAAVTPVGKPVAEKVTLPVKPFIAATVIVLVPPVPPCVIVTLEGAAEIVKFGVSAPGHAFTKLATFTVPMPVAKSQPVAVP